MLDEALMTGFSRLPESLRDGLDRLAGAMGGSPLAGGVADAVERVKRAEFSVAACLGLAAARCALMGAAYDALRRQVHGDAAALADETQTLPPGDDAALLAGVQQWLAELAVAGLGHLSEAQLMPFTPVLAQMQARESLGGTAALLAGFCDELVAAHQRKQREGLPARRWADLWCAALLGAQGVAPPPAFQSVSGRLHPCGVDVRAHRSCVMATLWGVLESVEGLRAVRWPLVSWKVSVLGPDEVWRAFGEKAQPVLAALAAGHALEIRDAELSAAGDLRVTGTVAAGGASDVFALAPWTPAPAVRAVARHPVHLAELVRVDAPMLPPAMDRLSGVAAEVDDKLIAAATSVVGLLRWDDGWRLQPLALRGGGKLKNGLRIGQGIAARLAKLKTETLPQLEERASRLLRA